MKSPGFTAAMATTNGVGTDFTLPRTARRGFPGVGEGRRAEASALGALRSDPAIQPERIVVIRDHLDAMAYTCLHRNGRRQQGGHFTGSDCPY
jgi:hypothetical protein